MTAPTQSFDVSLYRASPGWVLIEPIQDDGVRMTASGIAVTENWDNNHTLLARAKVISAGIFLSTRADRNVLPEGWLPPGTEIQYVASEVWTLRGTDGRTVLAIRSQQVVTKPK